MLTDGPEIIAVLSVESEQSVVNSPKWLDRADYIARIESGAP